MKVRTVNMNRKELIEKRSINTKVFENQDHSCTAEIYLAPVHYKDTDGTWKEMDNKLEESYETSVYAQKTNLVSEEGFTNRKGTFGAFFAKKTSEDNMMRIKDQYGSISWGVENCNTVEAVKQKDNTVCYPEILEGMELRCRVKGMRMKEDMVLLRKEAAKSYTYLYQTEGLVPELREKEVLFFDEGQNEIFRVQAPYMRDFSGSKSESIEVSAEMTADGKCRVTFTPDRNWLNEASRKFPVVIDPVTTTSKAATDIEDAYISSKNNTDNYYNNENLWLKGGNEIRRSFLKFQLPEIKTGDMIVNARLVMVSLGENGAEKTIAVHKVIQSWESKTINWDNKPIYEETVQDLCKFTADKIKYVVMDITRMVKEWYRDGSNNGLMLKEIDELSGSVQLMSSDWDSSLSDYRPKIEISYVNYSGLEDYWTYHSQNIGRAGTVHVNDYNGNLILEHRVMETSGSRMPAEVSLVYNTNDKDTNIGYGKGFRLNFHQIIHKKSIAGNVYYAHTDADGTVHYFVEKEVEKDGNTVKEWKDETGLDLTLIRNLKSEEPYTIQDKDGNSMVFNESGYLIAVKDKNGNKLTVSYVNNRVKTITDGAGRIITLNYSLGSDGEEANLIQAVSPSGNKKTFAHTAGRLTTVTDIDGKKVFYTYDSNGMLASAENINGYQVKYGYYTEEPHRVKSIAEYGDGTKGKSLTMTYGYNSTRFTDNKGRKEIYRFDNNGNLLHVHDGFGHAVSCKYNVDGNHVNRLENATKLQDNVVQLLKDPVVQAENTPWTSKISPEGAGNTEINTIAAECMMGNRSLKAECTSVSGYAYWAQNVKVKKGITYTASMYVKASVSETAEDGGAILRVRYMDKDGVQQLKDSEIIKKTTEGFVRLTNTFTVPEDSSDTVVKVYMVMWHAKGVMYGDMAQLETGTSANRCNLIDNGDFHLGTIEGFEKNESNTDGLSEVGIEDNIPIKSQLLVTASSQGVLRKTPSDTGEVLSSLTKHQLLSGYITVEKNGRNWYYAKTADGKEGYVSTGQAIPYLGGHEGTNSAFVAVGNSILYKSADKTSARVQEGIDAGVCAALVKTVDGTDGNKWYYMGLQIDGNRFFGYMPVSAIVRLCRNIAKVEVKKDGSYYSSRSTSGAAAGSLTAGTRMAIRGTSVDSDGKEWGVIRRGSKFYYVPMSNLQIKTAPLSVRKSRDKIEESVAGLDESVYHFVGEPDKDKKLVKIVDITGKKGDTYMVNAWGMGTSLPETDNDKKRRFGTEVRFIGTDGKADIHYTNFSPDIMDWQFLSDVYVAKKDYTSIEVAYTYCHNANIAYFDGLALYKENFGCSYTYDDENNLISVKDLQEQVTKFEYNSKSDMTGITDAKGNSFKYEYDNEETTRNVVKGTSAQNVVYRFTYDSAGNVLKSGCVDPKVPDTGTWITRVMTSDKNHVKSVTDAGENTVHYTWDMTRDLMTAFQDAKGNKISYTYDDMERLLSATQIVTVNGNRETVRNNYSYTDDNLTGIVHNGFAYDFNYNAFGNVSDVSVAGKQAVRYEYEDGNGNLLKVCYGNGAYIRYEYDKQNRIHMVYFKDAADSKEQNLYRYAYDKQGNIYAVKSYEAEKTYYLFYDFLDRLVRVRDELGSTYEYAYDANNCMESMVHTCGTHTMKTVYTYDKDSRETKTRCAKTCERTTEYDKFGRVSRRTWNTASPYISAYSYIDNGENRYSLPKTIKNGSETLNYTYDANGNIISIKDSAGESTFRYDELNQLIRENNHQLNKTITYAYDLGGNLTVEKEYAFMTAETLPDTPVKTMTGTYDSAWKDKLLSWDGTAMTYDAIGNMLTRGGTTYTWTQGRRLSGVENGKSIKYLYDHTGARVKKTVDNTVTEYQWAGDLLLSEKTDGRIIWYCYDSQANLISVTIRGITYFYVRNAQGDIIALVDADGKVVVKYTYDSWGKVVAVTGELADTVGVQNPFRYKGYYYDNETGMYYLKSRYYVPALKRFICTDEIKYTVASPKDRSFKNLYVYCDNNPYSREDPTGRFWTEVVIGAAMNVVSCGIAAKVTGQSYTGWDIAAAAFSGAIASRSAVWGGIASAIYAGWSAWNNGGTMLEIAINSATAFVGTAGIGSLAGAIGGKDLPRIPENTFNAVYGTGGNLVSSSTNAGIVQTHQYNQYSRTDTLHPYKSATSRCIGGGKRYNPRTGKTSIFKIFQSSTGLIYYVYS